jgi:hypothetical protein
MTDEELAQLQAQFEKLQRKANHGLHMENIEQVV